MKLGELASGLSGDDAARTVTGFAIDRRKVAPGTVFGAFAGARFNGEDFIADAVAAGAIAIVAAPSAKVEGAVHIADANPRRAFAQIAARFFSSTSISLCCSSCLRSSSFALRMFAIASSLSLFSVSNFCNSSLATSDFS